MLQKNWQIVKELNPEAIKGKGTSRLKMTFPSIMGLPSTTRVSSTIMASTGACWAGTSAPLRGSRAHLFPVIFSPGLSNFLGKSLYFELRLVVSVLCGVVAQNTHHN